MAARIYDHAKAYEQLHTARISHENDTKFRLTKNEKCSSDRGFSGFVRTFFCIFLFRCDIMILIDLSGWVSLYTKIQNGLIKNTTMEV